MKYLILVILLFVIILNGCSDEGSPVEPQNADYGWTSVYKQDYVDSIHCADGIAGYKAKEFNLSENLNSNDTVRITFYYQFKGNSQNTLKMQYVIPYFSYDLFSINLTENEWHYYLHQSSIYPGASNINKFKFYIYLLNGTSVNYKNINIQIKK